MGGIKTRVKFFGPSTLENLEGEINRWFDGQGKWFRFAGATTINTDWKLGAWSVIMAVFYEEVEPISGEVKK